MIFPGAGPTVLIVEDDAGVAAVLVRYLAQTGYRPIAAGTPAEAFAALAGERPAFLISDLHFPGEDGQAFLADIFRRFPALGDTTVVTSGDLTDPETREALAAHGCRLLQKPFPMARLLALLRECAAARPPLARTA